MTTDRTTTLTDDERALHKCRRLSCSPGNVEHYDKRDVEALLAARAASEIVWRPGDRALILFPDEVRRPARLSRGFVWVSEDGAHSLFAEGGFDALPFAPASTATGVTAGDDLRDQVAAAITRVEASRLSHQLWIDYLDAHPNYPVPEFIQTGDEHQQIVDEYTNVLAVLAASSAPVVSRPEATDAS